MTHEIKDISGFSLEDYFQSIHAKSAYYSVYGPMQMGAIIAGQAIKDVEKMKEYGVPVGNAFQTKDDILDCTSTAEVLGKTIGNDVMDGVKTAILWHFVRNSKSADLDFAKKLYGKDRKQKTLDELSRMLELFKSSGSIAYAEQMVDSLSREALEKFELNSKSVPESDLKETARNAIVKMTSRHK